MSKKTKISYVQQSEPNFITKFKEKISYKEDSSINTKREKLDLDDEDDDDEREREDEAPVVVVLKAGDLSADQVQAVVSKDEAEDTVPTDSKIVFKKPTVKRISETKAKTPENKRKKMKDGKIGFRNTKLLSFGDDDEDDDN